MTYWTTVFITSSSKYVALNFITLMDIASHSNVYPAGANSDKPQFVNHGQISSSR